MSDHDSFEGSDMSDGDPSPSTSTHKRSRAEAVPEVSSRAGKRKMSEFDKGVRAEAARSKREVNRLAQQQARFRRQQYIIELETRLELLSRPEPERIKHLGSIISAVIAENRQLRKLCQTLSGFLTEGLPSVLPRMGMTTELYDAIINRGEHEAAIDSFCANKKRLEKERMAALEDKSKPPRKATAPSTSAASTSASCSASKAGHSPVTASILPLGTSQTGPDTSVVSHPISAPPPPPPPPTPTPWPTSADDASASPIDYPISHNEANGTSGGSLTFTTPFPASLAAEAAFWSTASFSPSDAGRPSEPTAATSITIPTDLSRFQHVPLHGPPPPPPVRDGHWTTSSALEFLSSLPPGLAYGAPQPAPPAARSWASPSQYNLSAPNSSAAATMTTISTSSSHPNFFPLTTKRPPPSDPQPYGP